MQHLKMPLNVRLCVATGQYGRPLPTSTAHKKGHYIYFCWVSLDTTHGGFTQSILTGLWKCLWTFLLCLISFNRIKGLGGMFIFMFCFVLFFYIFALFFQCFFPITFFLDFLGIMYCKNHSNYDNFVLILGLILILLCQTRSNLCVWEALIWKFVALALNLRPTLSLFVSLFFFFFRYPRYWGFPGPDFSTGNGCVPPEGGVQYQHDDHKFVQDNASGGAASLQRYAPQGCTVHEPSYCQGLYHWGKQPGVRVTFSPFFFFPSIFISAEQDN